MWIGPAGGRCHVKRGSVSGAIRKLSDLNADRSTCLRSGQRDSGSTRRNLPTRMPQGLRVTPLWVMSQGRLQNRISGGKLLSGQQLQVAKERRPPLRNLPRAQ